VGSVRAEVEGGWARDDGSEGVEWGYEGFDGSGNSGGEFGGGGGGCAGAGGGGCVVAAGVDGFVSGGGVAVDFRGPGGGGGGVVRAGGTQSAVRGRVVVAGSEGDFVCAGDSGRAVGERGETVDVGADRAVLHSLRVCAARAAGAGDLSGVRVGV